MPWIITCAVFFHFIVTCIAEPNDDNTFYWRRSDNSKCEPFSTFMMHCNRCICGAEGTPYCTKIACPKDYLSFSKEAEQAKVIVKKKIKKKLKTIFMNDREDSDVLK